MNDFNAHQARQIVGSLHTDELHNILVDIRTEAQEGKNVLCIYKPLKTQTLNALRSRGFNVILQPSIAIQKDNLYYSITW